MLSNGYKIYEYDMCVYGKFQECDNMVNVDDKLILELLLTYWKY